MEKKSERLEVRLGYQEKQNFNEACELQGDTPSGAIRRFISGYVRRSDGDVLSTAWREAATRRGWKPLIFLLGASAILATFWAMSQNYTAASDDAIFTERDRNNDGQLEYAELGLPPGLNGAPNGLMRVLDLDASGTVSRAEFLREGRMVYTATGQRSDDNRTETDQGPTLVEFKFSKERLQSGTYVGDVINANGIDRLVIWPANGSPTVMESPDEITAGLRTIDGTAEIIKGP